ncbi:MAG: ABC-type transport auxiliary lipoprotein family protein [Acidobacteriota bacterium]
MTHMKYTTAALLPLALAAGAILGGCLGRPGPVEEYLRVGGGDAPCAREMQTGKARVAVALRQVKSADALDRQAVMLARGRVMSPSLRWYWEASPSRLAEQALVRAVNCTPGLAAIWPVRSSTEAPMSMTVTLTSFEVQEQPPVMNAAMDCQVWDASGTKMLSAQSFAVQVPVRALDAPSIAEAGSKALSGLTGEAAQWVASLAVAGAAGVSGK